MPISLSDFQIQLAQMMHQDVIKYLIKIISVLFYFESNLASADANIKIYLRQATYWVVLLGGLKKAVQQSG